MTTGLPAVIDMRRVFAEPGSPWATPRYAEAAAGERRLLPAYGEALHVRDLYRPLIRVTTVDEPPGDAR